jgi:RimJ/RimL family protein N-acetyltransferase
MRDLAKNPAMIAETDRLILRRWRDSDRALYRRMNSDPRVMEYYPQLLTPEESDASADRIEAHFQKHGFGLCAVELRAERTFIGYAGLSVPVFEAHFTPCVEIGWRLDADYWGAGAGNRRCAQNCPLCI